MRLNLCESHKSSFSICFHYLFFQIFYPTAIFSQNISSKYRKIFLLSIFKPILLVSHLIISFISKKKRTKNLIHHMNNPYSLSLIMFFNKFLIIDDQRINAQTVWLFSSLYVFIIFGFSKPISITRKGQNRQTASLMELRNFILSSVTRPKSTKFLKLANIGTVIDDSLASINCEILIRNSIRISCFILVFFPSRVVKSLILDASRWQINHV